MIYDDEEWGTLGSTARKLALLAVVIIGVPVIALGIGAWAGRKGKKKTRTGSDPESSEAAPAEKAPTTNGPVSRPVSPPLPSEGPPPAPGAKTAPVVEAPINVAEAPVSMEAPVSVAEAVIEAPVSADPLPAETRPSPSETKPSPTETKPSPTETKPSPTETKPSPTETRPTPTETRPTLPEALPAEVEPAPTETKPIPTETTPAPAETTPAPTEIEPTVTPEPEMTSAGLRQSVLDTLTLILSEHTSESNDSSQELTLEDRRQAVRLKVDFALGVYNEPGEVVALDLSLTGVRVKSSRPMMIGDSLLLSLPGNPQDEIRAVVTWCIGGDGGQSRAGLRFTESAERLSRSWLIDKMVEAGLCEQHLTQKRRWIRVHTSARVKLVDGKDREHEGVMMDLGVGGARLRCAAPIKNQEGVRLVLPTEKKKAALALAATVVGVHNGEVHLQFLPPGKGLKKRLENHILELLAQKATTD